MPVYRKLQHRTFSLWRFKALRKTLVAETLAKGTQRLREDHQEGQHRRQHVFEAFQELGPVSLRGLRLEFGLVCYESRAHLCWAVEFCTSEVRAVGTCSVSATCPYAKEDPDGQESNPETTCAGCS